MKARRDRGLKRGLSCGGLTPKYRRCICDNRNASRCDEKWSFCRSQLHWGDNLDGTISKHAETMFANVLKGCISRKMYHKPWRNLAERRRHRAKATLHLPSGPVASMSCVLHVPFFCFSPHSLALRIAQALPTFACRACIFTCKTISIMLIRRDLKRINVEGHGTQRRRSIMASRVLTGGLIRLREGKSYLDLPQHSNACTTRNLH